MNTGYTKLFASIIASTIWREKNHIRIVWVTMLAMADAFGRVMASVPGLADMARVTVRECQQALAKLSGPDEFSRTKAEGGRRIRPIDGGWEIVNYVTYRDLQPGEYRRRYMREYMQARRDAEREEKGIPPCKRLQINKHKHNKYKYMVRGTRESTVPRAREETPGGPDVDSPSPDISLTLEMVKEYGKTLGLAEDEAAACWDWYESRGWPKGDWCATVRIWKRRAAQQVKSMPSSIKTVPGANGAAETGKESVWQLTQRREATVRLRDKIVGHGFEGPFGLEFAEKADRSEYQRLTREIARLDELIAGQAKEVA